MPTPIGPSILCDEQARKSQSRARTSSRRWGADCAASISTGTLRRRATAQISAAGVTSPSTLDTWLKASSRVRADRASAIAVGDSRPSSSMSTTRMTAPVRVARARHGSRLE